MGLVLGCGGEVRESVNWVGGMFVFVYGFENLVHHIFIGVVNLHLFPFIVFTHVVSI
jgi:hypothetical protein